MFLSDLSIKRPVLTTCVMLALVILGLFSMRTLGWDLYPNVDIPVVTVNVNYPGASPDAVEQDVVKKIEEAVNPIEKVDEISSTSQEGYGTVVIQFDISRNVDRALDDVRSKVGQIRRDLPDTIKEPVIQKYDPAQTPVLSLVLKPDDAHRDMSPRELTRIADEFLKRRIENIAGVGKAEVVGGSTRDILVQVEPRKLEALGLSLNQVMSALSQDTQSVPSGNLLTSTREISVRVDAKARRVEDFNHVVVGNQKGRPIELQEVARIVDSFKEKRTLARLDGSDAVALEIQKQSGGNTVAMVEAVREKLKELQPELAKLGVVTVQAKDNSKFIVDAVDDVIVSIVLGGLLAVLVVFYFLKSWRSTIITSLTLPVSVIGSFVIMKALDFSLNTMTLMALSLAIGILIDDAIVVRENITRHAEMGKDHITAAREGTAEIGPAVIATTMSILAVFIPVAFMGGIVGRFFFSFGIVVAFAVAISLFVSFTLDPMLSAVWPDPEHEKGYQESHHGHRKLIMRSVDWFNDQLDAWEAAYRKGIVWALDHRWTVIVAGLGSFVVAMGLMGFLGGDFFPDYDRGDFQVGFKVQADASLEATKRKAQEIEHILQTRPDGSPNKEIQHLYTTIGTGLTGTIRDGAIYVKLADKGRRDVVAIRRELRERLRVVPGAEIDLSAVADMGDAKAISLAIVGPERRDVERAEPLVLQAVQATDGAVDISSSRDKGKPELRLSVDRKQASDLGVSPMVVASLVRSMVDGVDVAKYEDAASGEQYDVTLRLPDVGRSRSEQLETMTVSSSKKDAEGNPIQVKLSNVARFENTTAPAKLERRALQPQITVTANKEGKTLNEVVADVDRKVAELQTRGVFPEGVKIAPTGNAKHNEETAGYMATAMLLAVFFIYFVLASQFESFKLPITIMLTLPLSMVGMVLMLLMTGDSMSMMTSIGLILLMGLVTKNAILLVDRTLQNMREHGMSRKEALVEAGMTRLRPILMTTLAMIGGMLPLFLALGSGAQMRAPMARAVVGGIITSTLLTLVVIPVFFDLLDEFSWQKAWRWTLRKVTRTRTAG
ncbi:MAG TPA: efflux RND transporter permease subunit [Holophaga sp.]|nr:efflux RND transporter permease subunit [Holophaga sp.]